MELKRHYNVPEGWERQSKVTSIPGKKSVDVCTNPPPLSHIEVRHTGIDAEQHFATHFVEQGLAEGWMTVGGGKLILHAQPEDLVYTILRPPGRYCVHCGIKLEDDGNGESARAHVAAHHPDTPSPDQDHPAGYAYPMYYKVLLNPEQHSRFKKGA